MRDTMGPCSPPPTRGREEGVKQMDTWTTNIPTMWPVEVTREQLKLEIRAFLDEHPSSDEWDIADGVQLGTRLVIELCRELVREGKIKETK